MGELYQIGPLQLDAEACVLTRDGIPLPLGKRAVAVLATLVRAAPQYVPKATILEAAWPGVVVEESNLAVQILSLRRALATIPGAQGWVQTLARRGYRFAGPVARVTSAARVGDAGSRAPKPLPEPPTSFVGRHRELEELSQLLTSTQLLTLTGTGGVGKTRLALRLAGAASGAYRDGACLVELAELRDAELVPQAVINALALQEQPGRPPMQTLTEQLRSRDLVLLVDNAEHLLPACARLADAILRHCSTVTLVVTSREPLGVPGETTYRVPSLSMPDGEHASSRLADCEAPQLFAERVRLHRPHFTLTDENAPAIARICRRLDGIALAIELAAARVRAMSVDDIDRRLDQRFALLTGGARTLPARQHTLRAAIDWSFDLLTEAEKKLLCAIAVFAGGFTLEAAEHICANQTIHAAEVLDLITSLADKSLVVVEERDGATRYRLLDTMRAYALERARALFHTVTWATRHLEYFLALAEQAEPQLRAADQQAWLDRLATEHDNVREALAHAATLGEHEERGLLLATSFARFWLVRGHLTEGRAWIARLLSAASTAPPATRAKALNWAGIFAWKQGDYAAAMQAYEACLAIRRELSDRKGIGAVLNNQGLLAYEHGDYRRARSLHEESLAIDRELGDRWGVGVSLIHLASLAMMQGDHHAARALNEESLAIFNEFGDRTHVANALRSLATVRSQQGEHDAARTLFEQSLAMCRELDARSGVAGALQGLGVTARYAADMPRARTLLEESLAIFRDLGDREGTAKSLGHLGYVTLSEEEPQSALRLHHESLDIYRDLGDRCGIAFAVEGLAAALVAFDLIEAAARLWGAMERVREEIGAPIAPSERLHYDHAVAGARASSQSGAFERGWAAGRALTLEQAVAEASSSRALRLH